MIPVEIQENSPRFQNFVAEESNEEREEAIIKAKALKRRVEYKYNSKLSTSTTPPVSAREQASPKWTGPFRVAEALGNEAYRLETLEGGAIPRTWNATNLKFYFS